jgi:hypothetical protein
LVCPGFNSPASSLAARSRGFVVRSVSWLGLAGNDYRRKILPLIGRAVVERRFTLRISLLLERVGAEFRNHYAFSIGCVRCPIFVGIVVGNTWTLRQNHRRRRGPATSTVRVIRRDVPRIKTLRTTAHDFALVLGLVFVSEDDFRCRIVGRTLGGQGECLTGYGKEITSEGYEYLTSGPLLGSAISKNIWSESLKATSRNHTLSGFSRSH